MEIPPPQEHGHADQAAQSPHWQSCCTHSPWLQMSDSIIVASQPLPLGPASRRILRCRVLAPSPQFEEHSDHSSHSESRQSFSTFQIFSAHPHCTSEVDFRTISAICKVLVGVLGGTSIRIAIFRLLLPDPLHIYILLQQYCSFSGLPSLQWIVGLHLEFCNHETHACRHSRQR